jgi:hypothetical protein
VSGRKSRSVSFQMKRPTRRVGLMPQNNGVSRYTAVGGSENEYMDSGKTVLKNKKGIADLHILYIEEEKGLARAYEQLLTEVRSDTPITSELIRYAHGAIFADLYEWAGRWRTVTISKPDVTWPPPDYLDQAMKDFEAAVLQKHPAASLVSDDDFCQALGYIQGEFLDANSHIDTIIGWYKVLKKNDYRNKAASGTSSFSRQASKSRSKSSL